MKRRELKEHVIYDSYNVYEDNREAAIEFLKDAEESLTEENIMRECDFLNEVWFEDELNELRRVSEGDLIAIADVGRWNGRFSGYKDIKCLDDVMYSSCDYEKIYVDSNGDLRKEESHHDGRNSILYRYWKDGINRELFKQKIYSGEVTQKDITRCTRKAGVGIAEVYGWKVRK